MSISSIDWAIGHKSIFGNNAENLRFTTSAVASADDAGGSHFSRNAPSSTVITLGDGGDGDFSTDTNRAETHVAYCFKEIQGFSKFSSYTGTGQSSGPFIYTGFRPSFLLFKCTTTTENWYITDNKREPHNDDAMSVLYPNLTNTEGSLNDEIDLLSNGFKVRGTNSAHNSSGQQYFYMAFGQSLVGDNNVPCTAR